MLEVGRVVRPHGLDGRVVVELWTNRTERIAAGAELSSGDRLLKIQSVSTIKPSGWPRYLVAFAGVEDREAAEHLRGAVLSAEALEIEGALWVHEMVGGDLFDEEGRCVGQVEAVEANPASDLLVLADGRLVPLTFVRTDGDRLVVDAPPGLLDEE